MRRFAPRLLFLALALVASGSALAESNIVTGNASPLTATARLDFQVTIPKLLYLRVGTGADLATSGGINLISFSVPAAALGNGVAVAATAGSGDLGSGAVTARVIGNNGNVTLTSSTVGALGNGAGDTISYGQILTTASALTSGTALPAPPLADGSTNSQSLAAVNNVVSRDARWTYTYRNNAVVAPGTYGGVNANNGRVTYTASMP